MGMASTTYTSDGSTAAGTQRRSGLSSSPRFGSSPVSSTHATNRSGVPSAFTAAVFTDGWSSSNFWTSPSSILLPSTFTWSSTRPR